MKTSSKKALLLAVGLVMLLVAYRILFPPALSDDQQINNAINAAIAASANKDVGGIMRPVSSHFVDGNGYTADQLRFMLGRNIHEFSTISVTTSSMIVTVKGDTATSEGYVTIDASGDSGTSFKYHGPMNLQWKKEPDMRLLIIPTQVWRVVKTDIGFGGMD